MSRRSARVDHVLTSVVVTTLEVAGLIPAGHGVVAIAGV
jgi:hypothetical protein